MIEEAQEEVLILTSSSRIVRYARLEMDKAIIEKAKRSKVQFRFLTQVTEQNLKIVKETLQIATMDNLNISGRHINSVGDFTFYTHSIFIIKDRVHALLFITPQDAVSTNNREDLALWTNCKALVQVLESFFNEMWLDATDVAEKISEIETGRPLQETVVIKNAEEAYEKFYKTISNAKEEIVAVTTPKGLFRISENLPVQQISRKGVKIRIVTPVNSENSDVAQKLSEYCDIRHIERVYWRIAIVDRTHVFQFEAPPLDKETTDPTSYFNKMFYTNDKEYVERICKILDDLWNRALDISKLKISMVMRSPQMVSASDDVLTVMKHMLKNDVGSVLVVNDHKLIGIITERGILAGVMKYHRDFERISARNIMSTRIVEIGDDKLSTEALTVMREKDIRSLVVTKEGKPVGILTRRQILAAFANISN